MRLPLHPDAWYHCRLAPPAPGARVVIDTDAANEIDDPFAIAWALLSPGQLQVDAVHAAPFSFAHRLAGQPGPPKDLRPYAPPGEGMWRSVDEIRRTFAALGEPERGRVFAGAERYLPSPHEPVHSPAVADLIERARAQPADQPLYLLALGCLTNPASALLLAPDIADRLVIVWTSGYPSHAPHVNQSFNLEQDPHATRVVLASGVPVVYLPGFHVGAQLRLSLPEMERWVKGQVAIGDHLPHLYTHNPLGEMQGIHSFFAHSWVIWDLVCVAWMLQPDWMPSTLVRTPRLAADGRWQADPAGSPMREAYAVRRDAVFGDFFTKLQRAAETSGARAESSISASSHTARTTGADR